MHQQLLPHDYPEYQYLLHELVDSPLHLVILNILRPKDRITFFIWEKEKKINGQCFLNKSVSIFKVINVYLL